MIKSAFLRRMLLVIIATLLLSAALTGVVFTVGAQSIFTERGASELQPKVDYMSELFKQYLSGRVPRSLFAQLVGATSMWEAALLALSIDGDSVMVAAQTQFPSAMDMDVDIFALESLDEQINKALSGQRVIFAGRLPDANISLLMVGQPVFGDDGAIIGAVFLFKPFLEVSAAMESLSKALFFSMCAVLFLMLPTAYAASMRLIRPIKNMRDVALTMAAGNFTIQANEIQKGEVGELARSLNYLAFELSRTISALVLERNRLQQILDGLSEGMAAVDSDNVLTLANPALMEFFHLSEGSLDDLAKQPDFEPILQDFASVMSENAPMARSLKLDNRIFRVGFSPLSASGRVEGAVALLRDITESERLEQTRRDYVANVSHELRTPLTALRGLIEPLNDGLVRTEDDRKRYYHIIYKETLRLSRLIDDLLELSRLQSDNIAMEREAFDVNEIVQSFLFIYENQAEQLGIALKAESSGDKLMAYANSDRVEQVLIILFDNALKFTPPGGTITVSAADTGGEIELKVSDTGLGISREDLPNVFERFYKADKAHGEPGTGLGLSIAREIVRLMGGRIWVKSEPDKGAAFTFTVAKQRDVAEGDKGVPD